METKEVSYIPAASKASAGTLFVPATAFAGNQKGKAVKKSGGRFCNRSLVLILSLATLLASVAILAAIVFLYEPRNELENLNAGRRADEMCSLPPEVGPCRAAMPRWYRDQRSGACRQFLYGGCDGNDNNFVTLAECEDVCGGSVIPDEENPCEVPPSSGPCSEQIPRFFFDAEFRECKRFLYSGCGGSINNFITEEACVQRCNPEATTNEGLEPRVANTCNLPADPGPCRAVVERWHHKEGQCLPFVWGGCGGNENNFSTKEKCESYCQVDGEEANGGSCESCSEDEQEESGDDENLCSLPKEVGICRAAFPRFYFNADSGNCESFIFGGCGGNANNFESKEDCLAACSNTKVM